MSKQVTDALSSFGQTFGFDPASLASNGWANKRVNNAEAVRVPLRDPRGTDTGAVFLLGWSVERGVTQRRWASGTKPGFLGLECFADAVAAQRVTICHDEVSWLTLRAADEPAYALLGDWQPNFAKHLEGIETIYVSPIDGAQVPKWL